VGLVMQASRGTEQLSWGIMQVTQLVRRYQQWEQVQCDIMLPRTLKSGDEVAIYIWQSGPVRDDVYFDDITIEKVR